MVEFQSEENKVLFSDNKKMQPLLGQSTPRPFFVQLPINLNQMRYKSKSRLQKISPLGIASSSWPLFLLVIIQLAVAVVAEDRVGQEELLVSVPGQGYH